MHTTRGTFAVRAAAAGLCIVMVWGRAPAGQHDIRSLLVQLKPGAVGAFVHSGDCALKSTGVVALDSLRSRLAAGPMRRLARTPPALSEEVLGRIFLMDIDAGVDAGAALEAFKSLGCFEYVELDGVCAAHAADTVRPNDESFYRQWGLHNDGTFEFFADKKIHTNDADIDMPEAWKYARGDSGIVVAILDSGCKRSHPDLAGRFWRNAGEVAGNHADDDGNQYVDDIQGWDFVNGDNDPDDTVGHGTAVAGLIACVANNKIGFAGVDWHCKLMALKVIDVDPYGNEGATFSDLYEAILYAVDNGANVINMSLGSDTRSRTIEQAIDYAVSRNVVVVASAGNENTSPLSFPARYSAVIGVGSTDPDDRRTTSFLYRSAGSGSNYGTALDVVAPGNFVYFIRHDDDTLYGTASGGTSFSAPLVSGLASVLLGQDKTRTVAEVRTIIEETADDQVGDPVEDTPGWDQFYGHGRINAFAAVTYGMTWAEGARRSVSGNGAVRAYVNGSNLTIVVAVSPRASQPVEVLLFDAAGRVRGRFSRGEYSGQTLAFPIAKSILGTLCFVRVRVGLESHTTTAVVL